MLQPQLDELSSRIARTDGVVAISQRAAWLIGLCIAGTVNSIAAVQETLTPAAIAAADVALTGKKLIKVPANCTYMEIGGFGDSASLSTVPILRFWRSHGTDSTPDLWEKLYNLLGNNTITFDGTISDLTNTAGASRYGAEEGTYQKHLIDLRGSRWVVVELMTVGVGGNWSIWHRFF